MRSVPQLTQRLNEAERLGFHTAIVPAGSGKHSSSMKIIEVRNLYQALEAAMKS